ncbi:MAG: SBBP repeat-containing protein, partial [bacterium]
KGFGTPAAVKFNSRGELHVLDTGSGEVIKIDGEERTVIATLSTGLDNFSFDKDDRLFVSSFTDGFVKRVEADGSLTTLLPSGMAHPGGLTLLGNEIVVADLHGIRFYDKTTGEETRVQRSILGVSEMGGAVNVSTDGSNLILVSWLDNDVRVWDPRNEKVLERYSNLAAPVAAVRYAGKLVVTEYGKQRVISISDAGTEAHFSFAAPAGLAVSGHSLFLTDRASGSIYLIGADDTILDQPKLVVEGLDAPEGFVVVDDSFIVVEAANGNIVRVNAENEKELLATIAPGSPAAADAQPKSMIFNGITIDTLGNLYVSGETSRRLYKISW